MNDMYFVLGLDIPYVKMDENDKILYQKYLEYKENKDFVASDKIRDQLIMKGIM